MIIRKNIWIAVFILFLLFTSMFVSLASIYEMPTKVLGGKDVYVIISSKDKNPIRSNIDLSFAYGIENLSYIQAVSPEIYAFTTLNGKSVTVRGVMFSKFFKVQGGGVVKGHLPHRLFDALIGVDAEKMFGIHMGDVLTLRGSFTSSLAIVNITGVFKTNSPADDEILVSIPTAAKLAGINPGKVSIIRVKTTDRGRIGKLLDPKVPKFVVNLNTNHTGFLGEEIGLNATIKNIGEKGGTCVLNISFENDTHTYRLYVEKEKVVRLNLTLNNIGVQNITAVVRNDVFYYTCYTQISVYPRPVFMRGPTMAFSNQTALYVFKTLNNETVENGTLVVKKGDYRKVYEVTNGSVEVFYPDPGTYSLNFTASGYENQTFNVSVYDRIDFGKIALVYPEPINGTIFLNVTDKIRVYTGGKVYYSFDGGSWEEGYVISIPPNMFGNHILNLTILDWRYMAKQTYLLHIVKNYRPTVIPGVNGTKVMYGASLKFILCDPVPILNATTYVNGYRTDFFLGQRFNQSVENYTYTLHVKVNQTSKMYASIYFQDRWGRWGRYHAEYSVIVQGDVVKPIIDVPKIIKIWSGNTTPIEAQDNVAVKNITVYVNWSYPKRVFTSTGNRVMVPTVFVSSVDVIFAAEGVYNATAIAYDVSGNRNKTNFTIVINNTGEKNPPLAVGNKTVKGYYNLSSGWIRFVAYDNVAVKWMGCYEKNGNTYILIKSVDGNDSTQHLTLYLNSSDFSNGVHYLLIGAYDVNLNFMDYMPITVIKNYTDTARPEIKIGSVVKLWSGNTTKVVVEDNVAVHNITVLVNWTYPQKIFNSEEMNRSTLYVDIPTVFKENGKIVYVAEGVYNATAIAYDVSGNRNETNFTIVINNTGEKNPPLFNIENYLTFGYLQNIVIYSYDNVGVEKMWIMNRTSQKKIAENYSSSITLEGKMLHLGLNYIAIYSEDVNGNVARTNLTVLITDDVKPWLKTHSVTIWGGNSTIITGEDNVQVSWINASFNGRYYNMTGNQVILNTMFFNDSFVSFLPEGNYTVFVSIGDSAGNVNDTIFYMRIDNKNEKNPPVIVGRRYGSVNLSSSLKYRAFDNVDVDKIWISYGDKVVKEKSGSVINLTYHDLPAGIYNITIYAEDVNGNIGTMNATVNVAGIKKIEMQAYLMKSQIRKGENDVIVVELENGNTKGYYNLTVVIDGDVYYTSEILLNAYERRSINIEIPQLSVGNHTIRLGNITLLLQVKEKYTANIPTDIVLKYIKNMKFSESKNVIYKGFQISEGNFILLLSSMMVVTLVLLFLGLYSGFLKGIKNHNIGILRAIGASNRQILIFFIKDSIKYVFTPIIIGVLGGYMMVIFINSLNLLTALGHRLIISPTPVHIGTVILVSIIFSGLSLWIVFRNIIKRRVVHIMSGEESYVVVSLDEILNSQ